MDERTKELIAIGASVSGHCQPCLEHHLAKARELGADEKDINTAIEIGQMVEKGALLAMKKHVDLVVNRGKNKESSCCSNSSDSCCG